MDFFKIKLQDLSLARFHGAGKSASWSSPEAASAPSTKGKTFSVGAENLVSDADIIDVPSIACLVDDDTGEVLGKGRSSDQGFRIYSKDRRVFYEFGQGGSHPEVQEEPPMQVTASAILRSRERVRGFDETVSGQKLPEASPLSEPALEKATQELLHRARSLAAAPGWEVQLDLFEPSVIPFVRTSGESSSAATVVAGTETVVQEGVGNGSVVLATDQSQKVAPPEEGLLDVDDAGRWILPMVPADAGKGVEDVGDGAHPTPAAALAAEAEGLAESQERTAEKTESRRWRWLDFAPFEAVQNFFSRFYVQELRPRLQYVYNFMA
jgi:hypothetical protein